MAKYAEDCLNDLKDYASSLNNVYTEPTLTEECFAAMQCIAAFYKMREKEME